MVIEKTVDLRELAFGQVILGHHFGTQHVHAREEPATTRRLLVGNALGGNPVREIGVDLGRHVGISRQLLNIGTGQCVAQGFLFGGVFITVAQLAEHLGIDTAFVLCPAGRGGKGNKGGEHDFR